MLALSAPLSSRSVPRGLTIVYLSALTTIAILTIIGQVLVQISLAQQADDAHIVNIAARQSTLSQRLSKEVLAIRYLPPSNLQSTYQQELSQTLQAWNNAQHGLMFGDVALRLPPTHSAEIAAQLNTIDPYYRAMASAATQFLRNVDDPTLLDSSLRAVLRSEQAYLPLMDQIATTFQNEAQARVAQLQRVEIVLLAITLSVLLLEALTIFRPTTRRLAQTIAALEAARSREEQVNAIKDQFITSVNHELRTPLMTMQGYIELLSVLQDQQEFTRRAAMLARARQACVALVTLVQSILDVRRIEQDAEVFTPMAISVRESVLAATALMDPREALLGERELQLAIADDMYVWGEEIRLRQVLTNLLSNAIKYSPVGTPITVVAGRRIDQRQHHPWIEIRVRDHGLGIPPDQIPLLFNRFVRLPRDLASRVLGNGLGLYLCRIYVEAMHGKIWVESSGIEGEGSTFAILLPAAPTPIDQPD